MARHKTNDDGNNFASVKQLLSVPFEEALRQCEPLRVYIATCEDTVEAMEEFRNNWHMGGPAEMIRLLQEMLNPSAPTPQKLLAMPFEQALQHCEALRTYISTNDEPTELETEFREAWHVDAPVELRQLLEELLWSEVDFSDTAPPDHLNEIGHMRYTDERTLLLSSGFDERFHERVPRGSASDHDGEVDVDDDVQCTEEVVGDLLNRPFLEAVQMCAELRQYIKEHGGDELLEEFRTHWSAEAPRQLREVLSEILDPRIAAASAAQHEVFTQRMAAFAEQNEGSLTQRRSVPSRSRM
uniref:Uncharacterized protein n=1 Tax=Noctiluca scintillans TaxID=2966 RepID=A0A7S1F742_NOCSC|mmetsp:Transcript_39848/g.105652  ORF Transcript_39848/g.105652 Transcript_39848/m.105652 type:complete len:298 (+) Transcript_39848:55-948(+)